MKTRREFLAVCSVGAAAALTLPLGGPLLSTQRYVMLEDLDAAAFAAWLGTPFRLTDADSVDLVLAEVDRQPARPGEEQFALLFHGPLDRPVGQRTYAVEHADIGRFHLFLVPVGRGADGLEYEAVFNRRTS